LVEAQNPNWRLVCAAICSPKSHPIRLGREIKSHVMWGGKNVGPSFQNFQNL
jgi:hypothetical protein